MKKINWILAMVVVPCWLILGSFHLPPPHLGEGKIRTLVIDAGHGGKDPGALGSSEKEKNVTLAIAQELKRILKENLPKLEVILTRDDDTFLPLHKRAKHAESHDADFFISIHCNSSRNTSASGSETYVLGMHKHDAHLDMIMDENKTILLEDDYEHQYEGFDPTSVDAFIFFQFLANVHLEQSQILAHKVQRQFKERVGRKSRGVKQAGFLVLWKASRPSILIETGFISNKDEEKFLKSKTGQTYMASAIYRAIKDYNASLN